MARDGSGNYTLPANTQAVSGDPISSTKFNTLVQDLEADANTDRPITAGGTGASTASAARTNLGLAIGTDVQAFDAGLQSIAGLTTLADRSIYTTASDTYAVYTLTAAGRAILDDADASAQRTTLGLGSLATLSTINNDNWSGTDLAVANGGTGASDASTALTNLGALAASAYTASDVLSKLLTVDGAGTGLDADLLDGVQPSAFGLTIIDDADASAARTTLGLANGATTTISAFALTMLDDVDAAATRTTLGLGTAALKNTGTSGDAVPLLNAANTFSAAQTVSARLRISNGTSDALSLFQGSSGAELIFKHTDSGLSAFRAADFLWSADGSAPIKIGEIDVSGVHLTSGKSYRVNGSTVWHAGNDGAGSGLDADTVDGAHVGTSGAAIPLLNGSNSWSSSNEFVLTGTSGMATATTSLGRPEILNNSTGGAFITFHRAGAYASYFGLDTDNVWKVGGWSAGAAAYKIWHEGNDGAGSGLDADTLDGVQGSAYATLSVGQTFTALKQFNAAAEATDAARVTNSATSRRLHLYSGKVGSQNGDMVVDAEDGNNVLLQTSGVTRATVGPTGFFARTQASSETTGTLTSASANKTIQATGDITINNSVFSAGDIILIYAGASARTLTQGSGVTMRLGGSATTGSRTLAARGVAMLFFVSASEVVVSGGAVT